MNACFACMDTTNVNSGKGGLKAFLQFSVPRIGLVAEIVNENYGALIQVFQRNKTAFY